MYCAEGISFPVMYANLSSVLNMGADVALLLSTLGVIDVGNPVSLNPSFSIGGKSADVSNLLDNVLGVLSMSAPSA